MNPLPFITVLALLASPAQADTRWHAALSHTKNINTPPITSIEGINRYVNQVPYRPDSWNYGTADYWASPDEFFLNGGDCEDYAIAKYYMIMKAGIKADMAPYFVKDGQTDHLVLIVNGMVLDNQTDEIHHIDSVQITSRYKK